MYANFICYNCYYGPVIDIFIHFKERIFVVLLVMHIPASIVTSADISQLWVYLCDVLIYGLRLELLLQTCMSMERG